MLWGSSLMPQEQFISRIAGFIPIPVLELGEEGLEGTLLSPGHLNAHQYSAEVRTVVAVVKQADVPAAAHAIQKIHQRPRALREFEAVYHLIDHFRRASSYHMANMQLGHLVVGQVLGFQAYFPQVTYQIACVLAIVGGQAHEYVRFGWITVAIVKLSN